MISLFLAGMVSFSAQAQQLGTLSIINQTSCKFDFYEIYATCGGSCGFTAEASAPPNSVSPPYSYPNTNPPFVSPVVPFPIMLNPSQPPYPTINASLVSYQVCKVNGPMGETFPIGLGSANPNIYTSVLMPSCNGNNHYTVVWTNPNANNIVIYILP